MGTEETNSQEEKVQVDTTKQVSGKIRAFNLTALLSPTPTILARVTKSVRYFAVGLITMVSGSDLFSGKQAKIINFCLGIFILALGALDLAIGVEPDKIQKAGAIIIIILSLASLLT